ncbi:unnamed protein product [Clavelina lepadiformis]|uniref:Uncharacterized protein n=1 Tax=Clavelina lepadiformis TaxID=159417 RepID=A0ABP0GRP4_CLALP
MQDMASGRDRHKISPMSRSNKHQAANQKSVVCLLAGCLVELVSLGVLRRAIEESLEVDVDFEKNKRVREDLEVSLLGSQELRSSVVSVLLSLIPGTQFIELLFD